MFAQSWTVLLGGAYALFAILRFPNPNETSFRGNMMKRAVLFAMALAAAATAAGGPAPQPQPVHAQGCVAAGVEAGCLVVKDVKSGVLYNLLIKGSRPVIGTGIQFTGMPHDGVTVCMQGVALDVTTWAKLDSLKCVAGQTPKP
jgi:hypothetical protein